MTTIVNTPAQTSDNNGAGLLIGIFILVVIGLVFFYYGMPALRNMGTPQINVPNKIDINVEQTP